MSARGIYQRDLAYVHHHGFGAVARRATPGLIALIRAAGFKRGLVVDLGCGSGKLARELVRARYDVLGVDVSRAMISLARATAPGARFVVGSLHAVPLPRCVAVLAIGEGVTYYGARGSSPNMPHLFRRVHRALAPRGLFIFDAVERSVNEPMRYSTTRRAGGWRVSVDVAEQPTRSLLTRRISLERAIGGRLRRSVEVHRLRTFARRDLEDALRAAGFVVRVGRGYGSARLPRNRFAVVARKPAHPVTWRRAGPN